MLHVVAFLLEYFTDCSNFKAFRYLIGMHPYMSATVINVAVVGSVLVNKADLGRLCLL